MTHRIRQRGVDANLFVALLDEADNITTDDSFNEGVLADGLSVCFHDVALCWLYGVRIFPDLQLLLDLDQNPEVQALDVMATSQDGVDGYELLTGIGIDREDFVQVVEDLGGGVGHDVWLVSLLL